MLIITGAEKKSSRKLFLSLEKKNLRHQQIVSNKKKMKGKIKEVYRTEENRTSERTREQSRAELQYEWRIRADSTDVVLMCYLN